MNLEQWRLAYDLSKRIVRMGANMQKWLINHPPDDALICHLCRKATSVVLDCEFFNLPVCNDCYEREYRVEKRMKELGLD